MIESHPVWRRKWQPTPVFLPGKVHGQRSLAGCSPWDYMTEHVCTMLEGDGLVAIKWQNQKKKKKVTQSCLTLWDPMGHTGKIELNAKEKIMQEIG